MLAQLDRVLSSAPITTEKMQHPRHDHPQPMTNRNAYSALSDDDTNPTASLPQGWCTPLLQDSEEDLDRIERGFAGIFMAMDYFLCTSSAEC